jgi:hypothetical protein
MSKQNTNKKVSPYFELFFNSQLMDDIGIIIP